MVKPRSPDTRYFPTKKERFEKITKTDRPGPGKYDTDKFSINYRTKKNSGWTISKDKRINFACNLNQNL